MKYQDSKPYAMITGAVVVGATIAALLTTQTTRVRVSPPQVVEIDRGAAGSPVWTLADVCFDTSQADMTEGLEQLCIDKGYFVPDDRL